MLYNVYGLGKNKNVEQKTRTTSVVYRASYPHRNKKRKRKKSAENVCRVSSVWSWRTGPIHRKTSANVNAKAKAQVVEEGWPPHPYPPPPPPFV